MTTNPQFIFVAQNSDATHSVEKLEVGRDTDAQKNLTELRKGLPFDFSFIMSEEAIYQLRQAGHIN
ncbi:hypothetical protein Ea357_268 [Erwinia phage Ea35-70]|uniref:Uncharacterized protein n=2 Tax=Agricanvirus TaxID=1984776 RepID=W6AS03_9CAUD|nr:hypothetical protein Ea357_268 [Erwinia phage Ea35-70]YP_009622015.1 hypothetical protein FDJ23_gp274 [Erwinia phage vB_EamM_Desertfox]AHI60422.1 hypothetical protein Ea357_268 [Erwinia phage Ea35-70]AUG86381.1 hypothetical protein DESERTFOX_274 [Erwinia phage vB_EamM_Desertfox]